jgi:hypothetical protein
MTLPWGSARFDQAAAHAVGGITGTTWDPARLGAGAVLSNFNLTTTTISVTAPITFSTTARSSGLLYFEITYGSAVPASWAVGLYDTGFTTYPTGLVLNTADSWQINGSNVMSIIHPQAGDIGAVAVDFTHHTIWFRTSTAVNWNGLVGGNPATNTSGADFSAAIIGGNFNIVMNLFDSVGQVGTLNTGASAFALAVPSGFSAWGGAPPATSFDPVNTGSSLVLTNSNLTVSNTTLNWNSSLSNNAKTTGKWYAELSLDAMDVSGSTLMAFGICLNNQNVNSFLGSSGDTAICRTQNGTGFATGDFTYNGAVFPATFNQGDIASLYIDVDAKKAWVFINGGNATGPQNPATGASPIFTWVTFNPIFIGICINGQFGTQTITFKPTAASQIYAPVSGFLPWG